MRKFMHTCAILNLPHFELSHGGTYIKYNMLNAYINELTR